VRNGIFTVMVVGFAGYCFYDWKVGYPQENLAQAVQDLPPEQQSAVTVNPKVTAQLASRFSEGDTLADVEAAIGPPTYEGPRPNGLLRALWFGPAVTMHALLDATGHRITQLRFQNAKHTETDLTTQWIMGTGLGALGIVLLIRWLMMLAQRTQLSADGLKVPGTRLIPFEAMTDWDTSDYKVKGRIKLGYDLDGQTGQVILDDYKIREFNPIVARICERKGFDNPLEPSTTEPVS